MRRKKWNSKELLILKANGEVLFKRCIVLRKYALKFREDFVALTELDPFKSATIAAACQNYFKTFVLKKEEIGIISTHGYQPSQKTSIQATQWLECENMSANESLQHKRAKQREKLDDTLLTELITIKDCLLIQRLCLPWSPRVHRRKRSSSIQKHYNERSV